MRWWLLLTITLTGAGCGTTTTVGSAAGDGTPRRLAENISPEPTVAATDGAADQPTVVVEASSPTEVRFRTEGETIVPIRRPRQVTIVRRGRGAAKGAWIGAGVGIAAGLLFAAPSQSSSDPNATCEEFCLGSLGPIVGATVLGGIGTGIGALAGALIGQWETVAVP